MGTASYRELPGAGVGGGGPSLAGQGLRAWSLESTFPCRAGFVWIGRCSVYKVTSELAHAAANGKHGQRDGQIQSPAWQGGSQLVPPVTHSCFVDCFMWSRGTVEMEQARKIWPLPLGRPKSRARLCDTIAGWTVVVWRGDGPEQTILRSSVPLKKGTPGFRGHLNPTLHLVPVLERRWYVLGLS